MRGRKFVAGLGAATLSNIANGNARAGLHGR
jgi:hypothetical protein